MDDKTLQFFGLNKLQARGYLALIKGGATSPKDLAVTIQTTRTNAYSMLERLVDMGLVRKQSVGGKMRFAAENPAALERLIIQKRNESLAQETAVKQAMPSLLSYFYTHSERPGIRFFEGREGIKQIFDEILRTGKTVTLVRSPADVEFYDQKFYADLQAKRRKLGIETIALSPNVPSAIHDPAVDRFNRFTRTWLPKDAYTAPVEWNICGDKVAIISYGHEAVGTIIESAQIAESLRQILALVRETGK